MQETASNLLGYFFRGQPQQNTPKKSEESTQNEHPLLLKFATNPYLGSHVDASINQKITFDADHITIPKKLFISLLRDLEKIKSFETQIKEQQDKINGLNKYIEELLAQSQLDKEAYSNLEKESENSKQELNDKLKELDDLIQKKDKKIEKYKSTLNEQEEELNTLKEENEELENQLELSVNEFEILKTKFSDLHFEYTKYKNILQSTTLNIANIGDKTNQVQEPITEEAKEAIVEKRVNLDYAFSERAGEVICEYIDFKDILSLKLVNRFLNIAITNNPRYSIMMIKQMRRRWNITRDNLLKRLHVHRDLAAKIPEPFIKHAFSKYIWNKETVGEYMITSIIQSENLFNLMLDYEGENPKESPKPENTGMSFFQKIAKKIDDVKQNQKLLSDLNLQTILKPEFRTQTSNTTDTKNSQGNQVAIQHEEVHQEYINPQNIPTQLTEPTQPSSAITIPDSQNQALSPAKTIQNLQKNQDDPEDLFELPETKRQLFSTYYANNPFCVFIQGDAFRNPAEDKKQMLQKASTYIEDILRSLIKKRNILAENKDFISQLLQIFAKMLVHSKVLLQEAKELEALKDYITSKYEEIKSKVSKFENSFEDYGEALQTEKKLKDFFSKKAVDLEAQLNVKNAKILNDSESLVSMENKLKSVEEGNQKLLRDKQDQDNKLKVLVKEVKILRTKNKELEEAHNYVLTGYHDIKIVFDTLDLDI